MSSIHLEPQPQTVEVDEHTKALLEQAQASARDGQTVTLEQSTTNMKRRLEAWQSAKEKNVLTA